MSGVETTTFNAMMKSVTDVFTIEKITGIMGAIITAAAPYALLYWGARKAIRAIFSAVKKGRVRV